MHLYLIPRLQSCSADLRVKHAQEAKQLVSLLRPENAPDTK